jgi:hypothetical protein
VLNPAGRLAVSVLLASFCLPEIFGGEEQFRQTGQASWFPVRRAGGIRRARLIGRAGGVGWACILNLARAAMRVRVARS